MHPQQLAALRIERDDRSASAAGRVEHAADHQRRAFELVFGPRPEAVGLEAPRDFELVEVARVDLIERRVLRAAKIGGVVRPLTVAASTARESTDPMFPPKARECRGPSPRARFAALVAT